MGDPIISAIIGAGTTLTVAVVGWLAKVIAEVRASSKYRRALGLVDPAGRWKCDWLKEDGTLYVADVVEIEGWTKNGQFQGKGTQPTLSYTVQGEVDSSRVVALMYRTVDFPKKAYVGVACMGFDVDGKHLTGYWYGRANTGEFVGGKTTWRRQ